MGWSAQALKHCRDCLKGAVHLKLAVLQICDSGLQSHEKNFADLLLELHLVVMSFSSGIRNKYKSRALVHSGSLQYIGYTLVRFKLEFRAIAVFLFFAFRYFLISWFGYFITADITKLTTTLFYAKGCLWAFLRNKKKFVNVFKMVRTSATHSANSLDKGLVFRIFFTVWRNEMCI